MSDKDPSPPTAEERIQRFRFRVMAPDGRELLSDVVAVRFPVPRAPEAAPQAGAAKGSEAAAAAAEQPKDNDLELPVSAIYATVKGQKQGAFHPEAEREGHKYSFVAHSLEYALIVPVDGATGQFAGRRQHHPVTLTRDWGAASPQLFRALVTNEALPTVEIDCYGRSKEGKEQLVHKVRLTNAVVCSFRQVSTRATKAGASGDLETVAFAFEKIEHLSPKGDVIASDGAGHG